MVPRCSMLCPYVYGLQLYGYLNYSCSLCFLVSSTLKFKIKIGKNRVVE